MNIKATEFKNRLGQYLDAAETAPVIIEKSGCVKSVLLSFAMYKRLISLEDDYWGKRALEAEKSGYLGTVKSKEVLNKIAKELNNAET